MKPQLSAGASSILIFFGSEMGDGSAWMQRYSCDFSEKG